ncbi:hypothetical protein HGRIS_001038 [Hohenbuehelia grisea]|uniref:Uncharacterized protein n=1 Tax=Hohenbuehelia grisea TaxID=104357 RepID=A0ABR3JN30_9AGAR
MLSSPYPRPKPQHISTRAFPCFAHKVLPACLPRTDDSLVSGFGHSIVVTSTTASTSIRNPQQRSGVREQEITGAPTTTTVNQNPRDLYSRSFCALHVAVPRKLASWLA